MPPAPSSARALQAILPQIAENKPYEAHQKARTFVSRYVKAGQYEVAIDVLFQSARELLKAGHTGSGVDLGSFLLDVYDTAKVEVNPESRGRMTQLIALTGSAGAWRKTLIDKSIAWSAKHEPDEIQITTDPTLNFLQLAIQTCQRAGWGNEATTSEEETQHRASRDAWLRLAARYRTRVIGGDAMRDAIDSLGAAYFDLPVARKGANPLQDMMSSLFGGGGEAPEARPRKLRRGLPSAGLD
ncbi:hypothetical protein FRC07_002584 [Ceratobasidium sp. 392]|nr:hypothetical protein FRC07_002584 [Ceratobasidium sp. 392]